MGLWFAGWMDVQRIRALEERVEALEWEVESAHGPGGETRPTEVATEVAVLRSRIEALEGAVSALLAERKARQHGGAGPN